MAAINDLIVHGEKSECHRAYQLYRDYLDHFRLNRGRNYRNMSFRA